MEQSTDITIEPKLRRAWQQERRFVHLRGFARFVLWFVALLAVDFLIDWGLFARTGRTANLGALLLVVNLAVLGWVLWREWLRFLRPFDPVRVALAVEKRHPALSSLLVSSIQLRDGATNQPNISIDLIDAMRAQAIEMSRPLDFREIIDFHQLRKLVTVAAAVLLLFTILSISWRDHFGVLLRRLAGSDARYPTRTQVVAVTGDLTVRIGDHAPITTTAGGVIPAEGRLFTRPAGIEAEWKELPMARSNGESTFTRTLKDLAIDTDFYVRLGDDRSEEHRIRVVAAPQLTAASVALEFPAYMNRPAAASDQLDLTVPEATTLRWTLRCEPAVKRCVVSLGDQTFEAALDADGTTVRFEATAREAFTYTFRWTERGSTRDFEFDDVQYAVQVDPDEVPEVELLSPAANGLATVAKVLPLAAKASDDHGLAQAWLVYSINGSEEERLPLHEFDRAKTGQFTRPWTLATDLTELQPGTQVTIAVEVADHHPDREGHLRRSATRQLTIVSPEVYLEWYRSELAAQSDELKRAREAEATSATNVDTIKKEEGEPQ